ncbi:hypothetical protein [Demequina lignilytica]|uniref:Uncharacterized protein n=1 Tax=Demequina lignilytica TaxID=3051663 RepID=A0AB35MIA3_9MICO|nr:hypothetical protein [Demequina sp. SYSU T0a273]MDN4483400.1 hypothetical protein [Demequina sp. SYSU T0a273]
MQQYIEWGALANVVLVGLLVGAGLPALFALGVRALAGTGAKDEAGQVRTGRKVLAAVAFGIVIATVVAAVAYIAAGGH